MDIYLSNTEDDLYLLSRIVVASHVITLQVNPLEISILCQ